MTYPIAQLRADIDTHRRSRSGVPDAVRCAAVAYYTEARARGADLGAVVTALGISKTALYRWISEARSETSSFVPVHVVDPQSVAAIAPAARPPLALVTPGGYRVEGLCLDELTRLLKALP